jgi:hypothetical protein
MQGKMMLTGFMWLRIAVINGLLKTDGPSSSIKSREFPDDLSKYHFPKNCASRVCNMDLIQLKLCSTFLSMSEQTTANTGCGKLTSFFIWHFIFKKGS